MLDALKNEMNVAYTANGAKSLRSIGSDCLNLFSTIGALRNLDEAAIVRRFVKAYAERMRSLANIVLKYGVLKDNSINGDPLAYGFYKWLKEEIYPYHDQDGKYPFKTDIITLRKRYEAR